MACPPRRCGSRKGAFHDCSLRECARRTTGNHQETSSDMNISGVLLPALQANGAPPPLSKGRVVTLPLADSRCLTKSSGGALFFPASRATTLAGLRSGETVASQAKITLHQQRNLLVLGRLPDRCAVDPANDNLSVRNGYVVSSATGHEPDASMILGHRPGLLWPRRCVPNLRIRTCRPGRSPSPS